MRINKQNNTCRLTVTNGEDEYGFDLEYGLAFGVFPKGESYNGDPYLAIAIQSDEADKDEETLDNLMIRMFSVMVQSYEARGVTFKEMTDKVHNLWIGSMAQHILVRDDLSRDEAVQKLIDELGLPKRGDH